MERWRWLPQDLGTRHIVVNIPGFELQVMEDGRPVLTMRAIVGRHYRRTPVFSATMTYLVLSPVWHIPPNLAVQDKLPLIRKDMNFLVEENIKVFQGWGVDAREIDPKSIDWSAVSARNFGFRLRQEPGPKNALGRVKFMFPNRFNVYIHDTPAHELFEQASRAFSSGCIRIQKAMDLAEYLLRGDPAWSREKIIASAGRDMEQTVRLPESIPVHLQYWTAWVGGDGTLQFRPDIYGRDDRVFQALQENPPRGFLKHAGDLTGVL
jgi:murein L,D-transpeptidase YcbB/YkuD